MMYNFIMRRWQSEDCKPSTGPITRSRRHRGYSQQLPSGHHGPGQTDGSDAKAPVSCAEGDMRFENEADRGVPMASDPSSVGHGEQQTTTLNDQLKHYMKMNRKLILQKERYRAQYTRCSRRSSEVVEQLEKTTRELEEAKKVCNHLYHVQAEVDKKNKILVTTHAGLLKELMMLKKSSNKINLDLQMQANEQEHLIKALQEDVYKVKDTNNYVIVPDSTIGASLDSLERAITEFCREHALKSKHPFTLAELLQDAKKASGRIMHAKAMAALEDNRMDKKAAGLVLAAYITHKLYQEILGNPLFFVNGLERGLWFGKRTLIEGGVLRLIDLARTCYGTDHKSANGFRSELFKLLVAYSEPRAADESGDYEFVRQTISKSKSTDCQWLAQKLLQDTQFLMVSPITTEMIQDLQNIIISAVEISETILIQRCSIAIHELPDLPAKFDSTSEHMQPHKTYEADLEDDDRCLDGKDVLLVTNPGIIAMGSSDGSDPSAVRVLKKARVWVGKL